MTPGDNRMRVLVCGSRTWTDGGPIQAILRQYAAVDPSTLIIHGAAQGADSKADYHARRLLLSVEVFPAKWQEHHPDWCPGDWCASRHYCVAAGPRRNQQMLDEAMPNVVWAFTDKPLEESKGTADIVNRAYCAHIPVFTVQARRMH